MMTRIVSEYFADPDSGLDRRARLVEDQSQYVVEMYEGKKLIESRVIDQRTEDYASDCAENWVMGVIK